MGKKIILVLSNSDSGLIQFRKELLQSLTEDYNVFCSVPDEDHYIDQLEELGCSCIITDFKRRGTNPLKELKLLHTYLNQIRQVRPHIVLTYTIKPTVYGGIACQITKTPYLSNITGLGTTIENGGILSIISLFLYKKGLRKASCVFFQNSSNREFFTDNRIVKGKTRLIPGSGVNTDAHTYEPYPEDADCFRFLFVGRVMKDKGIDELFQALSQMILEDKHVFLDIVGNCDDDYSEQLEELEQQGFIKYHGHQKDMHRFYTKAHCVVLPSYHEGMANVMLEAASTGRPVITCNIPGCQETFDDGMTGYGCEPRSVESLKAAMDKMYSTVWERRRSMGLAGRNKIEKEFDRNIVIQSYCEEIQIACKT